MSDFKLQTIIEQVATYDGEYSLPFSEWMLMRMVNGMAAECEEDVKFMDNPKRLIVRVTIEVKEQS